MSLIRAGVCFLLIIVAVVLAVTNFNRSAIAGKTITVEITNFEFKPAVIEVKTGDTIVFVNRDIVPHTATADDGSWDTGNIASDQSKSIVISEDMTLGFYCFYHQAMKGKLKL